MANVGSATGTATVTGAGAFASTGPATGTATVKALTAFSGASAGSAIVSGIEFVMEYGAGSAVGLATVNGVGANTFRIQPLFNDDVSFSWPVYGDIIESCGYDPLDLIVQIKLMSGRSLSVFNQPLGVAQAIQISTDRQTYLLNLLALNNIV